MERRFPHIISHSGIAPFAATQPWFLCSGALLCAAAALVRSPLWASLAALLFAAFLVTIARRAPAAFVLLAPMLVLRLTELASGAAIESGAIMSETGVTGEPTGAFARLALLQLVTIAAAALLIERYWPRLRSNFANLAAPGPLMTSAIVGTIGLATLILAALAWRHGLPLLGAIDRLTYLKRLDGTPFRTIMMNRIVIAPLVGLLVAAPTSRLLGLWLAAWLVILSITFGIPAQRDRVKVRAGDGLLEPADAVGKELVVFPVKVRFQRPVQVARCHQQQGERRSGVPDRDP